MCVLGWLEINKVLTNRGTIPTTYPFPHNTQVLLSREACVFLSCDGYPFCLFLASRHAYWENQTSLFLENTSFLLRILTHVFWWLLCWWSCFAAVSLSVPVCWQFSWLKHAMLEQSCCYTPQTASLYAREARACFTQKHLQLLGMMAGAGIQQYWDQTQRQRSYDWSI